MEPIKKTRVRKMDGMATTAAPTRAKRPAVKKPTVGAAKPKTAIKPGKPTIESVPVNAIEPDPRVGALDLSTVKTGMPKPKRAVVIGDAKPKRLVTRKATPGRPAAPQTRVAAPVSSAVAVRPRVAAASAVPAVPNVARKPIARQVAERPEAASQQSDTLSVDEFQDQFHLPEIHERVFAQPKASGGSRAGTVVAVLLVLAVFIAGAAYIYLTYYQGG